MKKRKKKPNKNAQERSEWFWWKMMGQERRTLKRGKGGALRRK
ncbi:hypothetical protein [Bacillus halotolerans]|nr:hypothetical protein [Bacillus halotolerans]WJE44864.1 hypothetical protein QRD86_09935 [Bacillus halotolerans]